MRKETRSIFVSALAAVCLTGCSVFIDQVKLEDRTPMSSRSDTLESALEYAAVVGSLYTEKWIERARTEDAVARGLITLGAISLGVAAFDGQENIIIGAAVAGGTTYALGSWNSSQGRPVIYYEGIKALICVRKIAAPFGESNRELLQERLSDAQDAYHELTDALRGSNPDAEQALSRLRSLFGTAAAVEISLNAMPQKLTTAVDKIRNDVNLALNGTLADLSSLPAYVQGLPVLINQLSPSTEISFGTRELNLPAQGSRDHVQDRARLIGPILKAQAAAEMLEKTLLAFDLSSVEADLDGCGVESRGAPLTLVPPTIKAVEGSEGSIIVSVSGGTKPYSARVAQTPAAGLSVNSPVPGFNQFTLTLSNETIAGTYLVLVTDATGNNHVEFPITIESKSAESPGGGRAAPNAHQPLGSAEEGLGNSEAREVQRGLCTPNSEIDGIFGVRTRARIKSYLLAQSPPITDSAQLTKQQIAALRAARACPSDRWSWTEKGLDSTQIGNLRMKLGLQTGAAIDDETRAKIKEVADADADLEFQLNFLYPALLEKIEK